jgi:hypothetical protein
MNTTKSILGIGALKKTYRQQVMIKNLKDYTPTEIVTYSGQTVNLLDAKAESVNITDIAHALSHINRWNGHAASPYSVAAHSMGVAKHFVDPVEKLAALLHDAHEAYLGDITKPMHRTLMATIGARTTGDDPVYLLKKEWDMAIYSHFGIYHQLSETLFNRIAMVDSMELNYEYTLLFINKYDGSTGGFDFGKVAYVAYLSLANHLLKQIRL